LKVTTEGIVSLQTEWHMTIDENPTFD